MFLIIQQAIVKNPPTAVDSLKASLNQMQMKIDSLEGIVTQTEIAKSYFTWILNSQLYIFSTIIALIALVSWKSLQTMLNRHRNEVNSHTTTFVSQHTVAHENIIQELSRKLHRNIAEANRSIYLHAKAKFSAHQKFMWGMIFLDSIMELETYKPESILRLVNNSIATLKDVQPGNKSIKSIKENMALYDKVIAKLKTLEIEKLQEQVTLLKDNLYHVAYSQNPPEDLLDNERLKSARADFGPTTSKTP